MMTLIKNIRISRHVGCWLSPVPWWPVKFVVRQKMDWQMRWSLLTFLGGWDDKQDRKMCVKVIIILALMMTKYLAAPSRITLLRQLPSVAEFTSVTPQPQNYNQFPKISPPVIQLAILMLVCSNCLCAFWANCKVLGLKGGCYDVCNFDCLFRVWNCEL